MVPFAPLLGGVVQYSMFILEHHAADAVVCNFFFKVGRFVGVAFRTEIVYEVFVWKLGFGTEPACENGEVGKAGLTGTSLIIAMRCDAVPYSLDARISSMAFLAW